MVDFVTSARFGRRALATGCTLLALTIGLGCGGSGHSQAAGSVSGTGGVTSGIGTLTTASGGQPLLGSGGTSTGGSGQSTAGGSQSAASGGQTAGGGSHSTASGGQSTATGGQLGTGGQTKGSGGQSPATGGQLGTGGQTKGSGGQSTGVGGQSTASGGQSPATGGQPSTGGQSATSAATGITINGTVVPKEKAIVFIHFGHSNMHGEASKPASLHSYFYDTQPGLWSYQGGTVFNLAQEPTAPSGTTTWAGPGMALLKKAAAAVSSSSGYQFISIGRGLDSVTSVDYQKTIAGSPGDAYKSFITDRAVTLKGQVTFGAIFIMLGITERHLAADQQPGYPARIQQIVSDIRADLGEPNLPVLYCDYEQGATGDLAPTGAVGQSIMPMTRSLPGLISNLVLVPTDGLEMQDDHHFDMLGHQVWADRAIALMQNHTPSWFPWK